MAEPLPPQEQFFPLLVESYIRLETVVTCLKNEDAGNEYKALPTKFKIAEEYYKQVVENDIQSPLLGLKLDYDSTNSILTVEPDNFVLELYLRWLNKKNGREEKLQGRIFFTSYADSVLALSSEHSIL